nr:hypothetical protein [Actibacterium ureilyticum]
MKHKTHSGLGLLGVALTLGACVTAPRPLPDILPDDRSPIGNRIVGHSESPGTFEVIARPGDWTEEFMCSAGDYVKTTLGQDPATRIYVVRPRGAGERGVLFTIRPGAETLDAAEGLRGDYQRSVARPGDSFRAADGASACMRILPYFWDPEGL